jgi:hypothetical protein
MSCRSSQNRLKTSCHRILSKSKAISTKRNQQVKTLPSWIQSTRDRRAKKTMHSRGEGRPNLKIKFGAIHELTGGCRWRGYSPAELSLEPYDSPVPIAHVYVCLKGEGEMGVRSLPFKSFGSSCTMSKGSLKCPDDRAAPDPLETWESLTTAWW